MRAISIKQPWAELIALGTKKIEYRSWQLKELGELLVVASASRQDAECRRKRLDPDGLVYGTAVCVVDLWNVTGELFDYRWHVRNPRRVKPFPVKGYASIYHVDDGLIRFERATKAVVAQKRTR